MQPICNARRIVVETSSFSMSALVLSAISQRSGILTEAIAGTIPLAGSVGLFIGIGDVVHVYINRN